VKINFFRGARMSRQHGIHDCELGCLPYGVEYWLHYEIATTWGVSRFLQCFCSIFRLWWMYGWPATCSLILQNNLKIGILFLYFVAYEKEIEYIFHIPTGSKASSPFCSSSKALKKNNETLTYARAVNFLH